MSENNAVQHRVRDVSYITDFNSPEADAIIRLQTNIDFASLDKKITCYAVTSTQEAEGKTTLACNLAILYAQKGLKVALVDLDLRQPAINKVFNFRNEIGVVEYVKGDVDSLDDLIHNCEGVDVISAGSHTPFPGKILSSKKMTEFIEELKAKYDYIILDTPPVLVVSDAYLIGKSVDGFLMVAAQHISKKKELVAAIKALQEKQMNVIGISIGMVTTDEDHGKGGYGGYANGYSQKYGYGENVKTKQKRRRTTKPKTTSSTTKKTTNKETTKKETKK